MLNIIGAAVGSGGVNKESAQGPDVIQHSTLREKAPPFEWIKTLREEERPNKLDILSPLFEQLATEVQRLVKQKKRFCVIGGDHSAAIGTWSGAASALEGPLGLIWIDAHEDAHTFETTPTGNIHGMPVATLLGHGEPRLTHILQFSPKILPQHLCLIGARSFEPAEHTLLKKLQVKVYEMPMVKEHGLASILEEAKKHILKDTVGYGISIDLDGIDPTNAPGVSTPVIDGIFAQDLLNALKEIHKDPTLVGCEIMEFNPTKDMDHKTEKLIFQILAALA